MRFSLPQRLKPNSFEPDRRHKCLLHPDEVSIGVMVKNNTAEYWLSFHVSG